MKVYKYVFFCEDFAHRAFIKSFLEKVPTYFGINIKFELEIPLGLENIASDHSYAEIEKSFKDYYYKTQGFNSIDLFVYGQDTDSDSILEFNRLEKLYTLESIEKPLHLLFLPVKSVEHWFLYLKSNDNLLIKNSFDNLNNSTAKVLFYGNGRPTLKIRQKHIPQICSQLDIAFLVEKSESFNVFVQKTKLILEKLQ